MSADMPTALQPREVEERWYERWEKEGLFGATPGSQRPPYTIVLPPPNVTGALHMGHALDHTLQDALVRRARMLGFEALWVPGTDHAGIATQNVVERELAKEGLTRHDVGRDGFVERVWRWKDEFGGRITRQMRRLGNSCDWGRERFTMDEGLSRAVRTIFVRWFEDGLIYRGLRIINWCPRCTTALSDIEVEHSDVDGELVTFRYELADGSGSVPVATTRVETMLGDTGVFVHPSDDRYRHLVGNKVVHPFFPDRDMPIVADDAVDPEFGTGAVKGTPAHDPLDFEMGERAGLDKINILDGQARVNEAGGPFSGLDRYAARAAVLDKLTELGLVESVERPYIHAVGHCYRCGTEVEPWLSEQWFVKMAPLARRGAEVVERGRVRIHPRRFVKAYLDWMNGLRDWCISRQLWWGHRIPVWYCDDCDEVIVALEDPDSCRACGSSSLRQDPDVLDTWFSSQLWPFSTLGWPDDTPDLACFYPTSVMVTGYEILYLWVARMIMSGLYALDEAPFEDVFIHGIVRDAAGKKMSKSLGNVVDPIDMIEEYGADALRFSLAFQATPGGDMNASEDRVEGARNFANKLWNAARFVMLAAGDDRPEPPDTEALDIRERWIISRLNATIAEVDAALDGFNFAEATHAIHGFVWSEFCDWYIELAKLELSGESGGRVTAVLVEVLDGILRLLHPVMPFVTEELWSRLRPEAGSIMRAPWPKPGGRDEAAEAAIGRLQEVVVALRRLRADHDIAPGRRISARIGAGAHAGELARLRSGIAALARLDSIEVVDRLDPAQPGDARIVTATGVEASVPLGSLIDADVERARLRRKLAETEADVARAESKLANDQFLSKAPAAVVAKERAKLDEARAARAKVRAQLDAVG